MPYDSNLDEQLFVKEWENETGKIAVSVFSYNKGQKKLQIIREIKDKEGNFAFAKLGRLSKEELQGILPFVQEALAVM
jgi:predicted transcriptional regulator